MSNIIPRCDWYDNAADAMVRHGKPLFEYANENNLGLRKTECDNIVRTKEFMAALRNARNKFYKELANDPGHSRNTAVGRLLFVVDKLIEVGQYDKAAASLAQLFKVEGWNKEQNAALNIFQEISGKDISELRKRLGKPETEHLAN